MLSSTKSNSGPSSSPAGSSTKPKSNGAITSFFNGPKTISSSHTASGLSSKSPGSSLPSFDKQTWISSLSPEHRRLLDLEINTLDETWLAVLHKDLTTPDFLSLKRFLATEYESGATIYPKAADIYSWSRHTPLNSVKVVILGQDPYHGPNQAHGLCFSVLPPTPAPPSLKNIYIALQKDYPSFRKPERNGGDLLPWADRGVLLLNSALTVRRGEANSHQNKGWEKFTGRVLEEVAKRRQKGVVFLAWGSPAQKRCTGIDRKKHAVLTAVHPSPLSAARGWFDCGHFRKANEWLSGRYGPDGVVDWKLDYNSNTPGHGKDARKDARKVTVNPAMKAAPQQEEEAPRGWRKRKPEDEAAKREEEAKKVKIASQEQMDAIDDDDFEDALSSQPDPSQAVQASGPGDEEQTGEPAKEDEEADKEVMDDKANPPLSKLTGGDNAVDTTKAGANGDAEKAEEEDKE